MCARHHQFWWHDEPGESWPWFEKNHPGRDKYLLKAKNKYHKWTIDNLQEVRKYVKDRDLKKLLIAPELIWPESMGSF